MALAYLQLLPYERRQPSDQTPLFNRAASDFSRGMVDFLAALCQNDVPLLLICKLIWHGYDPHVPNRECARCRHAHFDDTAY